MLNETELIKNLIMERKIETELAEAAHKALDSLARYKFVMFGYWAGVWVHLNRLSTTKQTNPFKFLVDAARERSKGPWKKRES